MPCTKIDLGNGDFAIACSRGRRAASCQEPGCNRPHVALCDFDLGPGAPRATCDRKMCAQHRRPQSGRGADGSAHRDYCTTHDRIAKERASARAAEER
jgi:hypothetical protein